MSAHIRLRPKRYDRYELAKIRAFHETGDILSAQKLILAHVRLELYGPDIRKRIGRDRRKRIVVRV